tara:strand:+ start:819 stop:1265 length:447 start_codon:yes stop_codon:yes gene_type:complete
MALYFNDNIRCYEDGRIERLWRGVEWREVIVKPAPDGYYQINIDNKLYKIHRIIASCFIGLDIDDLIQTVDHINRIRTDNRVENLRIVTQQQQRFNQGAKGYTYNKRDNNWTAQIMLNKKHIFLGNFDTEARAHQAYLNGKIKYHILL